MRSSTAVIAVCLDLGAVRYEYGSPIAQLSHGLQVTTYDQPNPAGLPYRRMVADDARAGWADVRCIRPRCAVGRQ
jgi:hypothetical protein